MAKAACVEWKALDRSRIGIMPRSRIYQATIGDSPKDGVSSQPDLHQVISETATGPIIKRPDAPLVRAEWMHQIK
jgi:hypothetical protein